MTSLPLALALVFPLQGPAGAPPSPVVDEAPADLSAAAPVGDGAPAVGAPDPLRKPPRCGCAPEALVRRGKTHGLARPLAVVLDTTTGSTVSAFPHGALAQATSAVDDGLPEVRLEPFARPGLTPSRRQLFRVVLDEQAPLPYAIGLTRPKENVPKDVVRVVADDEDGRAHGARLASLHLGPAEVRAPLGCGDVATRALAFTPDPTAGELAGFLVEGEGADGARATFVDVRHVRAFGLGRVDACDHGVALDDAGGALRVAAVGADLAVGPWFTFALDERVPRLADAPADVDRGIENPFLRALPGAEDGLGHDEDRAALGTMLGLVGTAATLAFMLWPALRRRRRRVTITCPVCDARLDVELTDPRTDGMFCPTCGKASVFVSQRGDGVPEAHVFTLDDARAEERPPRS